MNATAHQEKEKNEKTKKAREKEKQATNFEAFVCCPAAVIQGAALQKNKWEFPG